MGFSCFERGVVFGLCVWFFLFLLAQFSIYSFPVLVLVFCCFFRVKVCVFNLVRVGFLVLVFCVVYLFCVNFLVRNLFLRV